MKRQAAPDGQLASELADVLEVLQLSPRPMTWAGRMSCRKRAASAPSAAASTTGSSSNTSTKLGSIQARRLDQM